MVVALELVLVNVVASMLSMGCMHRESAFFCLSLARLVLLLGPAVWNAVKETTFTWTFLELFTSSWNLCLTWYFFLGLSKEKLPSPGVEMVYSIHLLESGLIQMPLHHDMVGFEGSVSEPDITLFINSVFSYFACPIHS